jgi:hypothetical protein
MIWRIALAGMLCLGFAGAQKYSGPRPPKPDVPYVIHADNLVETEVAEAKEEKRKEDVAYVVPGAESAAKTPLAGPIFVMQADKLAPEKLQLYRFEVKNGHREVFFSKKGKGSTRPRRINVSALGGGLYKIETGESLENGEYGLSPEGSNQVFCFQVY